MAHRRWWAVSSYAERRVKCTQPTSSIMPKSRRGVKGFGILIVPVREIVQNSGFRGDAEVHLHRQTEIDPETDQPVERKQRDQARGEATEELDDVPKRAISA